MEAKKNKQAPKAVPKSQLERIRKLAQPQRLSGIQLLDLSDNRIGFEGGKSIGEALRTNAMLQQLCLSQNPMTDTGEAVTEDLSFNELLHLEAAHHHNQ